MCKKSLVNHRKMCLGSMAVQFCSMLHCTRRTESRRPIRMLQQSVLKNATLRACSHYEYSYDCSEKIVGVIRGRFCGSYSVRSSTVGCVRTHDLNLKYVEYDLESWKTTKSKRRSTMLDHDHGDDCDKE